MVYSIAAKIILDSIADGVFTVDKEWNITSFNRAAERITGISLRHAIGQKCFDAFHANICQTACSLRETLKTGKEIIDQPVNILNSQGKIIAVSISTAVLKDERGRIIYVQCEERTIKRLPLPERLFCHFVPRNLLQDISIQIH